MNLHKAYNIRVGLFVESLVSNPSCQSKPWKQENQEEKRRTSWVLEQRAEKMLEFVSKGLSRRLSDSSSDGRNKKNLNWITDTLTVTLGPIRLLNGNSTLRLRQGTDSQLFHRHSGKSRWTQMQSDTVPDLDRVCWKVWEKTVLACWE